MHTERHGRNPGQIKVQMSTSQGKKMCTSTRTVAGLGKYRKGKVSGLLDVFYTSKHAKFTVVSSIEQELLPIEALHCGNREFALFCNYDSITLTLTR